MTQLCPVAEELPQTVCQQMGVTYLFIPVTPYLQIYATGWLWPVTRSLPIPELEFVKSFPPLFFLLLRGYPDSPCFTDVKAESQPGEAPCLRSHSPNH